MSESEKIKKTSADQRPLFPRWVKDNFDAFENSLNGQKSGQVHKVRRQAFSVFEKSGLPLSSNEEWKYTNISNLANINFKLPEKTRQLKPEQLNPYLISDQNSPRAVFIDGKFSAEHSNITLHDQSGTFRAEKTCTYSFVKNISDTSGELNDFYTSLAMNAASGSQELPIVALNTAFSSDSLVINAGSGYSMQGLLQLLFISSAEDDDLFYAPRVIINAEKSSKINIVESFAALGSKRYLNVPLTEINIQENAEVNYCKLVFENDSAYHLGNLLIRQADSSRSSALFFTTGSKLTRNEASILINGSNAEARINGLTVIDNQQHVDNHTVIDHAVPNSESHEKIKGIYAGKSKGVFNGTIIVREDAQKTNAYQSNQAVLLSQGASIDTKPQLKIWADDVKCTHGATVGQLDESALFYLRSRGIDKNTARNMLLHAFASEVFEFIKQDNLLSYLESKLVEKFSSITNSL